MHMWQPRMRLNQGSGASESKFLVLFVLLASTTLRCQARVRAHQPRHSNF